jgi:hypothetical protein
MFMNSFCKALGSQNTAKHLKLEQPKHPCEQAPIPLFLAGTERYQPT